MALPLDLEIDVLNVNLIFEVVKIVAVIYGSLAVCLFLRRCVN